MQETDQIREELRHGRPVHRIIDTVLGPGYLVLTPLPSVGLLVTVQGEGSFMLAPGAVPTIWDFIGAGISFPTSSNLYFFLAELLSDPAENQPGLLTLQSKPKHHHGNKTKSKASRQPRRGA